MKALKSLPLKSKERRQFWQQHLSQWYKQEGTAASYCRENNLSYKNFLTPDFRTF